MNTKSLKYGLLAGLLAVVGCTRNGAPNNGTQNGRPNYNGRTAGADPNADPEETHRMITGSHVPQPTDRPTFSNVSANVPAGSASRRPDSLVPSEPTVGAGNQSNYRLQEPSTGAGPEGEPTLGARPDGTAPKVTSQPSPRPARKAKPKATPTPTPN